MNRLYNRIGTLVIFFFATGLAWGAIPFNDTANRPSNIGIGVVIKTENNGFWRITSGDYYAGTQRSEPVYAYADGASTRLSFLTSGVTFYVESIVPMKIDSITRPANMNPGSVLQASSGDIWKIIGGSYYGGNPSTEGVVVYKKSGVTSISFDKSGVAMEVELLSSGSPPNPAPTDPNPTNPAPAPNCAASRYDPQTSTVFVPCLEIPILNSKIAFDTEWALVTEADGTITLILRRADAK